MVAGRRTLLLADDSIATQKVVSLTFGDEGFEVTAVADGQKALDFLRENGPPDIVLADCLMPGINGYELCERIKTDTRWRHIPVLLLVGIFEPFNEAEARRVGADDVLTKPFQSIRDLMSKVGSMLGGGSKDDDERASHTTDATHARTRATPPTPPRDASSNDDDSRPSDLHAVGSSEAASNAFAGIETDDQMIEATPAESFGENQEQTRHAMPQHAEPFDEDPLTFDSGLHAAPPLEATPTPSAQREEPAYSAAQEEIGEETLLAQPPVAHAPAVSHAGAFATQIANAAAADDALLDLGDIEPPLSTEEADDFILDLDDDMTPAPSASPVRADAASAFAEASHGESVGHASVAFSPTLVEAEPAAEIEDVTADFGSEASAPQPFIEPTVVASEAPVPFGMESSRADRGAEGDVARPPLAEAEVIHEAEAIESRAVSRDDASVSAGLITLEQLSPEVIDAVARRAVELLSERVVQDIAWDVVPELAERLIKRRLDEDRQK